MIRTTTALLMLSAIMATATTAVAVEPNGWCYCNPEAPACRSLCPVSDPPLVMQEQGWPPRMWLYQVPASPHPSTKARKHNYNPNYNPN